MLLVLLFLHIGTEEGTELSLVEEPELPSSSLSTSAAILFEM